MEQYLGQIALVAFNFAPVGWAFCDGSLVPIAQNAALFQLIGTTYGGDGRRPSLCRTCKVASRCTKDRAPAQAITLIGQTGGSETVSLTDAQIPSHTHQAQCFTGGSNSQSPVNGIWAQASLDQPYKGNTTGTVNMAPDAIGTAGGNQPHPNLMAYQALNYIIASAGDLPITKLILACSRGRIGALLTEGVAAEAIARRRACIFSTAGRRPERKRTGDDPMPATPFIGQVIPVPYNFAPVGWAFCNGQLLPISQNTALFSLLGTSFGGDGKTTFALPNLQGCVAIDTGQGPGLSPYLLGQTGGADAVTLILSQLATHSHGALAFGRAGDNKSPAGADWARPATDTPYGTSSLRARCPRRRRPRPVAGSPMRIDSRTSS